MNSKIIYHNRLPHIAPIGASFFVTFRLADSLPRHVIAALYRELDQSECELSHLSRDEAFFQKQILRKKIFGKYEKQLEETPFGDCHLRNPNVAEIVVERLKELHGRLYDLQAFCIMPNHVHILVDLSRQLKNIESNYLSKRREDYVQLNYVMKLIKGTTARKINQLLGRRGGFWAKDSFDHYIRHWSEEYKIVKYIVLNPVKAGIVKYWRNHAFTFVTPKMYEKYKTLLP